MGCDRRSRRIGANDASPNHIMERVRRVHYAHFDVSHTGEGQAKRLPIETRECHHYPPCAATSISDAPENLGERLVEMGLDILPRHLGRAPRKSPVTQAIN